MRVKKIGATGLLLLGVVLVASAIALGQGSASLFLIFPVLTGTGPLFLLGVLCIVVGMVLLFSSLLSGGAYMPPAGAGAGSPGPGEETGQGGRGVRPKARTGGVVLVGPIPIFWGSDNKALLWAQVLAVVVIVLVVLVMLFVL